MRSFCAFAKLPATNNRKAIMAGVNGIEIKVGQVWRTGDNKLVEIIERDPVDTASYPWLGSDDEWYTDAGWYSTDRPRPHHDLVELIRDENGKVHADSATLAEETLSALGWTFDGQAWVDTSAINLPIPLPVEFPVEQPTAELPVGMLDNPVSAPALLTAAAKHMYDRAAIYDKPEGERSMAQTVAVFEAYHGIKLTEAQGWHFMQVLKDVRLFTRETYHGDSAEDCIAYAALKAEAKAQEGGA